MSNTDANKEVAATKTQPEVTKEASNNASTKQQPLRQIVAQSDEIDLRALWEQFVVFLRRAIKVVIKRGIVLGVFLAIGAVAGYFFHQTTPPTYRTKMLIDTKVADYSILSGLLGTLQDLADEENFEGIADVLKVDKQIASTIISIKANDKLVVYKDLSEQNNSNEDKEIFQLKNQLFSVEVALSNNENFPILEKSIIKYLSSNEYLRKKINIQKKFYAKKKQKIRDEVRDLDSLKKNIAEVFTRENQNIQITDPGTVTQLYEKAVKLREDELRIDTTLALLDNVQVVDGFVKFNQPSIKVTTRLATGLYIGFALWFMLVLWLDVRKPFMKFLEGDEKNA